MKSIPVPVARFRSSWPAIGSILAVSAGLIGVALFIHFWKGVPIGSLTRDPATVADVPIFTGFLSQAGIFFWSASAAICLFSAKVLAIQPDRLGFKRFLLVSGLLTLVLGLDDVFLLHEVFFPHFGVPENLVYVGYAGFVFFYLLGFRSIILETEYALLGMALGWFGLSVILDVLDPPALGQYIFLVEDGAKLVGVVTWLAYYFRVGACAVQQVRSGA